MIAVYNIKYILHNFKNYTAIGTTINITDLSIYVIVINPRKI